MKMERMYFSLKIDENSSKKERISPFKKRISPKLSKTKYLGDF